MNPMKTPFLRFTLLSLFATLAGCAYGDSDASVTSPNGVPRGGVAGDPSTAPEGGITDPNSPAAPLGPPAPPPNHCDFGKSYKGFGGTLLEVGRVDSDLGIDQGRVKPFSAMGQEYKRVLGSTVPLLAGFNTTFDAAPARWYVEPQSSAVSVFTSYRVAFAGCLTYTANPSQYQSAPDPTSAATECTAFATAFWSRQPSPTDIEACVQVATVDSSKETDPKRRWAYACASVLTAAGFLTF